MPLMSSLDYPFVSLMKDILFLQEIIILAKCAANPKIKFCRHIISFIVAMAVQTEWIILLRYVRTVIHLQTIKKVEFYISGKQNIKKSNSIKSRHL